MSHGFLFISITDAPLTSNAIVPNTMHDLPLLWGLTAGSSDSPSRWKGSLILLGPTTLYFPSTCTITVTDSNVQAAHTDTIKITDITGKNSDEYFEIYIFFLHTRKLLSLILKLRPDVVEMQGGGGVGIICCRSEINQKFGLNHRTSEYLPTYYYW